jgi:16S rRNA (cytosine967-C5)-methyltransferase
VGAKKEPAGLAVRQLAAGRLREVLGGSPFRPFDPAEIAEGRDRALANRLVTTALRRHGHLNLILSELLERGMPARSASFEAVLRVSLTQLIYIPDLGAHSAPFLAVEAVKRDKKAQHLAGLMNAVLRRAQANSARYWTLEPVLALPLAAREKWTRLYGTDAVDHFADALMQGAALDLTLRDEDPELVAALGAQPVLADTVRIDERDRPVDALPGYAEGRWWVQDAASALPARLLDLPAGARVLDLCAAPGGKTAQLVKDGYAVTAIDSDPGRVERLKGNLARLGYEAEAIVADAENYRPDQPFDAVLLDAPCSATGSFRRHPEVLLRTGGDLSKLIDQQRRMLANAVKAAKPGGTLIYCVCSLEPEEGEAQAQWALDALDLEAMPIGLPDFPEAVTSSGTIRVHPGLTIPGEAGGTLDGFFVARFRRR